MSSYLRLLSIALIRFVRCLMRSKMVLITVLKPPQTARVFNAESRTLCAANLNTFRQQGKLI